MAQTHDFSSWLRPLKNFSKGDAILISCAIAAVCAVGHLNQRLLRDFNPEFELKKNLHIPESLNLPRPFHEIFSLGHPELFQHLLLIHAIHVNSLNFAPNEIPALEEHTQKMLKFEPKDEFFYLMTCFKFALELKVYEPCREITLTGIKNVPSSWLIPFIQGFIYLQKVKDPAQAAYFFSIASTIPGSPMYLPSLIEKIRNDEDFDPRSDDLKSLFEKVPAGEAIFKKLTEED